MFRWFLIILIPLFAFSAVGAEIAVFPVVGVNADRSYIDAFGMLLAKKYEAVSGQTVIDPRQSGRALGEDSGYIAAAEKLGVSEYIELTAIGLFVSRKEYYEHLSSDSGSSNKIVVVVKNDDDDDDDDDDNDQKLLDNNKTVVTAIRKKSDGATIHKAELTLVTYGDIEEATERFATALYKKISVEEARSLTNITRREGMGHNKLFAEKIRGVKVGGYYPLVLDDDKLAGFTSIGYNIRMESRKFFVEFGVNGRFPGGMLDETRRSYGGVGAEVGASYLFIDGIFGLYGGGGVIPHFNFLKDAEMGIAPYLQFGFTFPRNSRTRFYLDVRVAQNVLPVSTGKDPSDFSIFDYDDVAYPDLKAYRPCEIGMNIGIGW